MSGTDPGAETPWPTKHVYDPPAPEDGHRVLVDRLWPRGLTKEKAQVDLWLKDIAPSTALRQWFAHRSDRFEEFARKYTAELDDNPAVASLLRLAAEHPRITLLHAAKHPTMNNATVLSHYLTTSPR
ncbi:DUF488 family protein [Sphaerisporangium sp. B11E5]|uniref:DUF488 domain-containing protein n=1 Tax=Sphaerisporangium sp. B11E5 TaxID=3153563 RepID=UPI00325CF785